MHNVEIWNCSQINTEKAAVRFEGATGAWSHLSGVSIHNGHGWGINVQATANLRIDNTIVFSFKPMGFVVRTSQNITVDSSIVAHVYERNDF
jgi:polygalacturonase